MDEIGVGIGSTAVVALIGKIVWDWLKNRKEPKEVISVEHVTELLINFRQEIKKDIELAVKDVTINFVSWSRFDELRKTVEDLRIKIAVLEKGQ